MGLSAKAVLPMVLGLGCDTMATMTTRISPPFRASNSASSPVSRPRRPRQPSDMVDLNPSPRRGIVVNVENAKCKHALPADYVLITVGRFPDSENLGLEDPELDRSAGHPDRQRERAG